MGVYPNLLFSSRIDDGVSPPFAGWLIGGVGGLQALRQHRIAVKLPYRITKWLLIDD
jgi:hypothetical protein